MITFIGSILWIAFFSTMMVWWASIICVTIGMEVQVSTSTPPPPQHEKNLFVDIFAIGLQLFCGFQHAPHRIKIHLKIYIKLNSTLGIYHECIGKFTG